MLALILGILGFVLYFIYDINSFAKRSALLSYAFMVGTLLVAASTILQCIEAIKVNAFSGISDILFLLISLIMFAALIYCLFFALPFQETYTNPFDVRKTYTFGAYALCRHPGVICFFLMYLFLGLAALPTRLIINGMSFSVLNIIYACFQDKVTFHKTFVDYEDYTKQVPFLIPTRQSVSRAIATWGNRKDEGGNQ